MRQNPSFAMTDVAEVRRVIRRNPWATIVSDTADGLVASHYAVMLDGGSDDLTVVAHAGRSDARAHGLGEREVLIIFQGPHGYITPQWYGDVQAVPTWNYVAVHLRGVPEILSDQENLTVLEQLVEHFEGGDPGARGMYAVPNDPDFVHRMARGTVGFRLRPTSVAAERKLSQNKSDDTIDAVIAGLAGNGPFANRELAAEMRRSEQARRTARG